MSGGFIMKKKVAVIFTGGTISMKVDPRIAAAIPALSSEEIMNMVTNIDKIADIEVHTFGRFPGPQMTPERIWELSKKVKECLEDPTVTGVVVTHGTDSLEETAYFHDLTIKSEKPVVFVAAMRNSSELGYDGPANLSAGIVTAVSDQSKNKGVLVVLNNEINAAREVTKSHTMSLDTFKSMEFGPLGIVDSEQTIYYRDILFREFVLTDSYNPKVALFKACVGMDDSFIEFALSQGYEGIIIEAMGRGNIPPEMARGVETASKQGVPVIIVSRCPMGRVYGSYGYEGGGQYLQERGAIFSGNLNGPKARIKLMLALEKTKDLAEIKRIFEGDAY